MTCTSSYVIDRQARLLADGSLQDFGAAHGKARCQRKRRAGGRQRYKLAILRQELCEWFLARRSASAARLTYTQVAMPAGPMRDAMIKAALRRRSACMSQG